MSFTGQLRGFWRAFRSGKDASATKHSGHSLARAMKESTHIRSGSPVATTEAQAQIAADGHENFAKSFESET